MTVRFVDTNVLLYAISTDTEEQNKKHAATELLRARDLCLSSQVLGEFYVQATRQTRPDRLTHDQAASLIRSFSRFPVQAVTLQVSQAAVATCDRFQVSYWDAAIIEASRAVGAAVVLSEDLQVGMDFDGVAVLNPFLATDSSSCPRLIEQVLRDR